MIESYALCDEASTNVLDCRGQPCRFAANGGVKLLNAMTHLKKLDFEISEKSGKWGKVV
jgi:hypothetical protein